MKGVFVQQLELWQQGMQTSLSCCRSMSLRCVLLTGKPPYNSEVIKETFNMINEKISASVEIYKGISSIDSLVDPVQTYTDILEIINQQATTNANRLMNK